MKNIYILGATGTIGLNTIEVVLENKDLFNVVGISLGFTQKENHENIIKKLKPEIVCLREPNKNLEKKFKDIIFVYGDLGLIKLASYPKKGILVNGISGSSGLKPTVAAIKSKKDIALANKETLVMAGAIINKLVKENDVSLIPVDSEHSAILNLLLGEDKNDIKSITITASGGSFRDLKRDELKNVTLEEALKHPNWMMGPKITIDSATMVNKGLEVIEAHHLFGLAYHNIHTVLHKESVVHGFVTFKDQSVKALLGTPDMKMPILYALTYPNHKPLNIKALDLTNLDLSFRALDFNRYPLLRLAYEVGKRGGLYPVIYNAANEAAVKLFLNHKIKFIDIEKIITEEVKEFNSKIKEPSLEDIIETNELVIRKVLDKYGFFN